MEILNSFHTLDGSQISSSARVRSTAPVVVSLGTLAVGIGLTCAFYRYLCPWLQ